MLWISLPVILGLGILGILGGALYLHPAIFGNLNNELANALTLMLSIVVGLSVSLFVALTLSLLLWKMLVPNETTRRLFDFSPEMEIGEKPWLEKQILRYMLWFLTD